MARKRAKAKEAVKLRFKQLSNNNRSIYLDIYHDGKRTYEFLKLYLIPETSEEAKVQNAETMKVAGRIKMQKILDILDGKAGITSTKKNKITLIDWMEQTKNAQVQNGKRILSTYNNTIKVLRAYKGDKVLLKDVDVDYCLKLYQYLLTTPTNKTHKPLLKSSILIYTTCLNTALEKAVKADLIVVNPYKKIASADKVKGQESPREYLTIDELKMLADTPCKHNEVKLAYMFACFCGLRLSDIERLTWGNIVEANGQYRIEIVMQKTQCPIYLPLSEEARKWLPERDIKDDNKQLIFPHLNSRTTINSVLKTWASAAGIAQAKASRIHFHVSRGTFATTLISKGADLYTTSKLLGHKSIAMTTVYAKIVDQKKVDAVNLLNDILK